MPRMPDQTEWPQLMETARKFREKVINGTLNSDPMTQEYAKAYSFACIELAEYVLDGGYILTSFVLVDEEKVAIST